MKNTLISLDVIFISKDKLITEFINNATPLSQEVYTSKKKIKYILEINSSSFNSKLDLSLWLVIPTLSLKFSLKFGREKVEI